MIELLRRRRSVRKFKSLPIEEEKMAVLAEALLRAPTSRNRQPCQFILVDERNLLAGLSEAKPHGAAFFNSAPLAVVIAADPKISDVWIEDASIAATDLQLAAEELGLKSCWAQFRCRPHDDRTSASDVVRTLVGLPPGMEVPMAVAIGYADEEKPGHPRETLRDAKIHHNRYAG